MKKLNLGCGNDIRRGWINLDINKHPDVDVIHDLNQIPLPLNDDQFDIVFCMNILEHVNYISLINDIHRILKKEGILAIRIPHFTSKSNYYDPTHINFFSSRTFKYFIKDSSIDYDRELNLFSIIDVKIRFEEFNIMPLRILNKFIERWVNKSSRRMNFYERSFLRLFPAISIEVILRK